MEFGSKGLMAYIDSNKSYFDLQCYGNRGRDIYNAKCDHYKSLKAVLVYTIDRNGVKGLFRFWTENGKNCYSELNENCLHLFETKLATVTYN